MERRAVATFEAQWPGEDVTFFASSAPTSFAEYCTAAYSAEETVGVMLKDFQALVDYPKYGWLTPQTIPEQVHKAAKYLKM
jgi:hypothetical protein